MSTNDTKYSTALSARRKAQSPLSAAEFLAACRSSRRLRDAFLEVVEELSGEPVTADSLLKMKRAQFLGIQGALRRAGVLP
jgi:hypothetical protein